MTDTPGRAFARYRADDDLPVSLPGYLSAEPSQVAAGDVFSYDTAGVPEGEELDPYRFEPVSADEVSALSPNAKLTKAVLAERLGVEASAYSKADLVSMADDADRANPAPPSDPDHVEVSPPVADRASGTADPEGTDQ